MLRALRLRFLARTFDSWQRLGVHVTPVDYEQPIPDTSRLGPEPWAGPGELPGIRWEGAAQLRLLAELAERHRAEYAAFPRAPGADPAAFHLDNGTFESVDAELLHAVVRRFRPRRVMEIGSGNSTFVTAAALRRNAADGAPPATFVAYEPWPNARLTRGVPGLTRLEPITAQRIPLRDFLALEAGDILFIDSSHLVQVGGDVNRLLLDVLPRLNAGVIVHLHDIFLPHEYPERWVRDLHRFWTEQYLLQAFLVGNREWEVLLGAAWLAACHPEVLAAAVPSFDPARVRPGSFWMRRVTAPEASS